MSRGMTFGELGLLLEHISRDHSPFNSRESKGKQVKYLHPSIDMRSNSVFSIQLRGYSWEKELYIQNECRDIPESLFERCMTFLDEPHAKMAENG